MPKDFTVGQFFLENMVWLHQEGQPPLIPVIVQEEGSQDILMFAWMSNEALIQSIEKKQAVYWSRSRKKLWHKGQESGHFQDIISLYLDCDGDCLILVVKTEKSIACHTGRHSCFFWRFDFLQKQWQLIPEN
jgi:phosphoribosyl-AMP cyclohydrolase